MHPVPDRVHKEFGILSLHPAPCRRRIPLIMMRAIGAAGQESRRLIREIISFGGGRRSRFSSFGGEGGVLAEPLPAPPVSGWER